MVNVSSAAGIQPQTYQTGRPSFGQPATGMKAHENFNVNSIGVKPQSQLPPQFQNDNDNTRGLLNVISNPELMEQERREAEMKEAQEKQASSQISSLAGYINREWQLCRTAKIEIEQLMLDNLRQRRGFYDTQMLQKMKEYDSVNLFMKHTDIVCRSAGSWIMDLMLPPGEKPWSIQTTPIPELPAETQENIASIILQEQQRLIQMGAQTGLIDPLEMEKHMMNMEGQLKKEYLRAIKEEATKQEKQLELDMDDDLTEGGFYDAMRELIYDITTFPACILHGPIPRRRKVLAWEENEQGGNTPVAEDKIVYEWERVSPFDIYPSPGAKNIQLGRLCHRLRWQPQDLEALIGVPGFDEGAIRMTLQDHAQGVLRKWLTTDTERATLENRFREQDDPMATIDVIKYSGYAQGGLLLSWGMDPSIIDDPIKTYNITAYLVGNNIISARLNPHPLGKRNYFSTSFVAANDSIWGQSIPDLMDDIQKILNSIARALVENVTHASGPQQWVNVDRMPPGVDYSKSYPRKVWPFSNKDLKDGIPMGWFQPQMNANELMAVYEYFFKLGSEVTGIPRYIQGSESAGSGAGSTATGLSMLMNAASKGIKQVIGNVDHGIIKPAIKEAWLYTMLFKPEKAGGDINVVARASEYLIQQETLALRRMEFMKITQNPIDLDIMGKVGRSELLRENAKSLKMPTHNMIPDREDLEMDEKQAEMAVMAQNLSNLLGIPAEQAGQILAGIQPGGMPEGPAPGLDGGNLPGQGPGQFQGQNQAGQKPGGADMNAAAPRAGLDGNQGVGNRG